MPESQQLAELGLEFRKLARHIHELTSQRPLVFGDSAPAVVALYDLARVCENRAGAALVDELEEATR